MNPEVYKSIILRMAANFPGLYDGEQEVPAADLVEWMSNEIWAIRADRELAGYAILGSPSDEEEQNLADLESRLLLVKR
jgi:hypothetical protein